MGLSELEQYRADIHKCFRCNLCKMVPLPLIRDARFVAACPISSHYKFHAYSGSGLQFLAHSLIDGRLQPSQEMAEIAFACRVCGYCDVACKTIMDAERTRVIELLREHLVEAGLAPPSSRTAIANLREHGHVNGPAPSPLPAWARAQGIPLLPGQRAEVLLIAGSELRGDAAAFAVTTRFARLLRAAGVDVGVLADEPPCGIHAAWLGYAGDFTAQARAMAAAIAASGAATVVTPSATALGMLRARYHDRGIDLGGVAVLHAAELLRDLIAAERLRLPRALDITVTWHDPCHLGRLSERTEPWDGQIRTVLGQFRYEDPPKRIRYGTGGVYDAPRQVLEAIPGVTLIEMARIREYALCCGHGGGGASEYPDLIAAAGGERLREAATTGAAVLATGCGFCARQFRETVGRQNGAPAPRVADLVDLVFEASGLDPAACR